MSKKQIPFDSFVLLAETVVTALREAGPSDVQTIAQHIRRSHGGRPQPSAISKVLTQYLGDRVVRCGKKKWSLEVSVMHKPSGPM